MDNHVLESQWRHYSFCGDVYKRQVQVQSESEELKEFSFDHVCSKEDLIAYLFDLSLIHI